MMDTPVVIAALVIAIVAIVLFIRRGRKTESPGQVAELKDTPGTYDFEVVGESRYQDALFDIAGGKTNDGHRLKKTALLIRQDNNPHDSKAVAVTIDGEPVGYLDRESARSFRQKLKGQIPDDAAIAVPAMLVGGWDRGDGDEGHFGVRLDIPIAD